jgi:RHS repeat-associated protein
MNPAAWGSLPASACTLGTTGGFGPDRITKTIRDANGRPTQIQVAIGTAEPANERTLGYNNNGTLAHLIDANDNRTTYEYDGHDRLVKTRLPLPAIGSNSSSTTDYEQLTLDAGGNVTSRRLRDGQSIAFTFDALNRVTLKDLPGSEPDVSYGYDLLNRMTSASQGGNNLAFTFDALNRKLTEAGPLGAATSTYDLAGRRTTLALPGGGITITYDRDVIGGVTAIRENGATSGVGILATYQYDSLGRRSSVTRGNGTSTNYSFDAASRLSSLTQDLASTANDLTIGPLAYNPASQITALTRSNDLYAWTGHSNQNIASVPNGLNQLTSIGGVATTHDGRGNLTGDPTSGKTYGYSSENMLTSATGGVTLAYDPFLRMSQVAGAATTRFGYDGIDLVAEGDGTNAILRRYVPGPGVDEPVVWYEGTGTADRRWLHADERGSVLAVSNASGNSIITNRYDEYGTPQSTNSGRFQYTGQKWIGEIGAYDYRARIYSPFVGGRFLQTDPIGFTGGINLYAYVRNDPVNLTDPSGLDDETIIVTHPRNPKCEGICYGPPSDIAIAGPSLFWLPHFEDVGGAVERSRNEKQQCTQYDEFFEDNFTPALGVAMQYSTNVFNLLGLAALESDWGRSPMSRNLNNPFGATPGGFSTPGVPYGSFVSAWQNWGQQWGVRVAGTVNNANAFVSNLGMNNQGTTGRVDTRGPYNTQNARTGGDPKWGQKVKDTIKSAKKRGADWNPACSEGGN